MKPLARYAALSGYVDVSRSVGLDPGPLMRSVGLDPASLALQDRWVPAADIATLLERSAQVSGHEDFGLRLAEHRRLSNLGPLSLVLREEPDVRSTLRVLSSYEHMYNEAMRTRLTESGGVATIKLVLELGEQVQGRQSIELAVAVLHRLLRELLGVRWRPLAVCFAHSRPIDAGTHRRVFGPTVSFDREFNGVVLPADDLTLPNQLSDPTLRRYAQQVLQSVEPAKDSTVEDRVRDLIELLLPAGRCSVDQVASSLGVDRRTIHRWLRDSGTSFSSLLDSVRSEQAQRMLLAQRYSLTEIAHLLAFSAPSNFSRWFRSRHGCSPGQWRYQADPGSRR